MTQARSARSAPAPRRRLVLLLGSLLLLGLLPCALIAGRAFYYTAKDDGGRAPPAPLLDHPEQVGVPGLRSVSFRGRDGVTLRGWYAPARNRAAVVVTSGTSANRLDMLGEVRILAAAGFGVLAFDWPGTGQSGGRVDWDAPAVAALEGAIDWLEQQPGVDPQRLGALGFSAGGMVTTRVAASDARIRATVLSGTAPAAGTSPHWLHPAKNPLHTLPSEWAARLYGWPVGRVHPVALVGLIAPRPLLIIGGTRDIEGDPQMVAQMCAAAGEPKECWVVPGATHGGYAQAAPVQYASRLQGFFERGLLAH